MDEAEGFLGRWSRLKRRGGESPASGPETAAPPPAADGPAGDRTDNNEPGTGEPGKAPPPLPPIESLDAGSDYTAFLAEGVPEELRRLALRKAWTSDPKIAEFRGFGEYDWDYNAPGYGALRATDDLVKLVDSVLKPRPEPKPEPAETEPAEIEKEELMVAGAEPEEPPADAPDPPPEPPPDPPPDLPPDTVLGRTA